MTQPAVPVCYRHPQRETYVSCVRCGRPICPECMREAPVGFQCPECVAEGQRATRQTRTAFGGSLAGASGYVTITLVVLNVIVLFVGAAMSGAGQLVGGLFSSAGRIQFLGAMIGPSVTASPNNLPPGVTSGEVFTGVYDGAVYRMVTSMFIHYGLIHLAMNMWALWQLGRALESALGPLRFASLYLLCGLGGSVAVLLFQPEALSAGASGAIFGLFSALFVVLKKLGRSTSSVVPVIVFNLIFTFTIPGISIAAHVGGLVTGAVVGAGLAFAPRHGRNAVQAATFGGVALILAMLTAGAIVLH